jgi:predicted Zn-dependent peptidase
MPNSLDIQTMNDVFAQRFSRLNMNLRGQARLWRPASCRMRSASAHSSPMPRCRPTRAPSRCTKYSGIGAIIGTRPVTDEELARAKAQSIRALPGSFETTRSVLGVLVGNALYTRADDYVTTLKAKYEAQTDADIEAAAKQIIQPDALTWVIVGDLKKIEQPLRALKLGEVSVLDADGKTVP